MHMCCVCTVFVFADLGPICYAGFDSHRLFVTGHNCKVFHVDTEGVQFCVEASVKSCLLPNPYKNASLLVTDN